MILRAPKLILFTLKSMFILCSYCYIEYLKTVNTMTRDIVTDTGGDRTLVCLEIVFSIR